MACGAGFRGCRCALPPANFRHASGVWQCEGQIAPHLITAYPLPALCSKNTTAWCSRKTEAGAIGTVVHIHDGGAEYEVEFMTLVGETVAVTTLLPAQLRPIARRDITHIRELQAA